ncbi:MULTISPECIES: hypothetical protein [Bacteria]|uniref:hypothetical protein n=1 Tax=Bacteria TaxID=2 RepID=UPI003F36F934
MMGSVAGLYLDFFMWDNIEDISKTIIKGGEHKITSTPVNFVYNKIRKMAGKEATDGLALSLKFAGKSGAKALFGKAALNYFFNPYVGLAKSAIDTAVDFRKNQIDSDFTRHSLNVDLSMSYKLDDRFNAINNMNLRNMDITSHQIGKVLSSGNLAEEILEQALSR